MPTRPVDAGSSVVTAVAVAMARPAPRRYDDLLVTGPGATVSFVPVAALLAELTDDLDHLAARDDLTGLPDRRHFLATLDRWMAASTPVGLLLVDLDGFRPINAAHGHAAGDAVLAAVANRFRACARPRDLVARLGGDEFALALPDTDPRTVSLVAERLSTVMVPAIPWRGHQLLVSASIGRAHGRWTDVDAVLRAAGGSLDDAKRSPDGSIGPLAIGACAVTDAAAAVTDEPPVAPTALESARR